MSGETDDYRLPAATHTLFTETWQIPDVRPRA